MAELNNITIFSRDGKQHYEWLINDLKKIPKVNVKNFFIGNNKFSSFRDEIAQSKFAILYHSKKRGRVNITDVTDSLYDNELTDLSHKLGKQNVLVVIDDLDQSSNEERDRILDTQPRIRALAKDLFLFSTKEKDALMMLDEESSQSALKKLETIKNAIRKRIAPPDTQGQQQPVNFFRDTQGQQQPVNFFRKYFIWLVFIVVVILIVVLCAALINTQSPVTDIVTTSYLNITRNTTAVPHSTHS